MTPYQHPSVATNRDAGPRERNERGVDVFDGEGGMVYLRDINLPRVISLLAQHLSGATVRLSTQTPPTDLCDSEEIAEARAELEQQIAALVARRDAIDARERALMEPDGVPVIPAAQITLVSLRDLLVPGGPPSSPAGGPLVAPMTTEQHPDVDAVEAALQLVEQQLGALDAQRAALMAQQVLQRRSSGTPSGDRDQA